MCIKFHESAKCSPIVQYPITFSGKQLKWFSSVKHLGHIFDCCLSFTKDVVCKKDKFVGCVNNIVTEFGFAHPRCKAKMVKTYRTSFYASCLWDLFEPDCQKLFTTWHIAMRIILELRNTTHRRFLDQLSGLNHIHHILKCCFVKFMQSLSNSNNNKLVHLYNICHKNKQSPTGLNIVRIACEYNIKSCDIQQCNMLTQMNKIDVEKSKDLGNDQWKIYFMNELMMLFTKLLKVDLALKKLRTYYGF